MSSQMACVLYPLQLPAEWLHPSGRLCYKAEDRGGVSGDSPSPLFLFASLTFLASGHRLRNQVFLVPKVRRRSGWAGTFFLPFHLLRPAQDLHTTHSLRRMTRKQVAPTPILPPVPPTQTCQGAMRPWAGRWDCGRAGRSLHNPLPNAPSLTTCTAWALGPWLTTGAWDKPHRTEPH